jgi:hypothetical protein
MAYAGMRHPPAGREPRAIDNCGMQHSKKEGRPRSNDDGAAAPTGSTDQAIGRPGNWREGRYQRSGARIDQSVNQPSQTDPEPHDTVGTQTPRANRPKSPPAEQLKPVTLRDYEK